MPKKSAAALDCDVSSVHHALDDARFVKESLDEASAAERDRVVLININFKIHPAKKAAAEAILDRNGTTLSAFMRACVYRLVRDYMGEKAAKKLEEGT